ncbi:L-proline dehydrogenase [Scopulibacillus darangshiensis]|uniref:proline dehydrogenase n=1 Tax=Scopulibacillus darangshiensis TaxID=442528 RepID=A0A4R2NQQ1_9BACL|nr:proline dehydrogenase family protein [Scopulibacillus darangshiensis]TCP23724.1 L-proline dehydrogenase [Scopulibacillus darangshiensis]
MGVEEQKAADALKAIARDQGIKSYIQQSPDLYPLFQKAAKRFVTGETREEGISAAESLRSKGYRVSLEYIGENTSEEAECIKAKNEFVRLMKDVGSRNLHATISFDLSHIGLFISEAFAQDQLEELAEEAKAYHLTLMISMEESAKTDSILSVFKRTAVKYSNIGITLQAHLKRTANDLEELLHYPGTIRIVKGAYQEPEDISMSRSGELNKHYLDLAKICQEANHPVSIATHDESLIKELLKGNQLAKTEFEMLYGVRPDMAKELKDRGCKTKIYLTYGEEWYLYLCHRLAEYPPNIYTAISDIVNLEAGDDSALY